MRTIGMSMAARAVLAVVLAAGTLAACSSEDAYPGVTSVDGSPRGRVVVDADVEEVRAIDAPAPVNDGGVIGDGAIGDGAAGDGGGDAGPAVNVVVTVVAPAANVVVPALQKFTPQVDVTINATGRADDSLKSLTADVVQLPSNTIVTTVKLNQVSLQTVPETESLVYHFGETPIDVAMAASGNYSLTLTATTNGGVVVKSSVPFQIDAGPTIRIDSPEQDKAYKGSALVDVTITDDYFGPVSDIQMKIGQNNVTVAGPGGASGHQYTGTLDFSAFMPALEGAQILTVRAKNKNGTEAVLVRKFISDSTGPTFANPKPKDGDLVGNVITIAVDVDDPAGVLSSSVVAVFANGPGTDYTVALQPPAAGSMSTTYSALFDTRLLPFGYNALFPTLSFRASDTLGNESLLTTVVWLDNRAPLAEMDPPDLRVVAKNDAGNLACSWPFDPVGPDAVDDADLVPQVSTIRARIEDQGNEPLSGTPNYIPISGVKVAQLLVLDDVSQALIVNTNPTAQGNIKADDTCDALNPLLVPTTRPMTSHDALLISLVPISPAGVGDLTNTFNANLTLVGEDFACGANGSGGDAKGPDPICSVAVSPGQYFRQNGGILGGGAVGGSKAKWRVVTGSQTILDVHSDVATVFVGYAAGGPTGRQSSIWTIPAQQAGPDNPLCGGTQFDALANFLSDGWACMAVFTTDQLGNKQVSPPLRVCVDKDNSGGDCPHKAIAQVIDGTPLTVQTVADHGFADGDQVKVSGITMVGIVNGIWTIKVTGTRSFTLVGSQAQAVAAGDWVRPLPPVNKPNTFIPGYVVRMADVPNCTGTQTAAQPTPMVDAATPCKPWKNYEAGERLRYP